MCGIAGIVSQSADLEAIGPMIAALSHRGPDGSGIWSDGLCSLGHRRLAIIDLSVKGKQPLCNEDETVWIVFNGEIYNAPELRRWLLARGHRFQTASDTETLIHLYEEQGVEGLKRLRGMFSVALWDSKLRRLVLARDRFGIKPLYYRDTTDGLEFASELRALPRGEIDLDALEAFLAFNSIPAPLTIFREVRKLPPGHVLVREQGKTRIERFARPAPEALRLIIVKADGSVLVEPSSATLVEKPAAIGRAA